ncbi:MAG: thiosulfate/3-mercaptopyruvate sulfurtransferase [Gaiellaceae bacterium]|nr:thiosulfate/3-mercaptopyruvate sulfurtransferase [Gaiellaceae bacterium]MDX6508389.1 thiosulfate/3-mercaptopyruvate sulfurtransferase [Gaiellaceae bacterium]
MIELAELASRLDDAELTILDVRSRPEFTGERGYASDPRQGRIPGARHLWVNELIMRSPEEIRALVGLPEGAEIVAYCHSGVRSAHAVEALRAAGYRARNYAGSWQEWSRHEELGVETGPSEQPK